MNNKFTNMLFESKLEKESLAKELGVSVRTVRRWMNAESIPSFEMQMRIAKVMLLPLGQITQVFKKGENK